MISIYVKKMCSIYFSLNRGRYMDYQADKSVPIPRTTLWRQQHSVQHEQLDMLGSGSEPSFQAEDFSQVIADRNICV